MSKIVSHNEVNAKAVGARVRKLRTDAELTQAELATLLGVAPMDVSHYEVGRRVMPLDVAFRLARRHGVTLDWLYGYRTRSQRRPA